MYSSEGRVGAGLMAKVQDEVVLEDKRSWNCAEPVIYQWGKWYQRQLLQKRAGLLLNFPQLTAHNQPLDHVWVQILPPFHLEHNQISYTLLSTIAKEKKPVDMRTINKGSNHFPENWKQMIKFKESSTGLQYLLLEENQHLHLGQAFSLVKFNFSILFS
ncbi:excinuclease ABC subunit A [Striga asiatica]|uniref:Excinuclease ABC subunit A n=1 Tax=Striga asiatica TaxID=4170 RepID=A0A5A7R8B9_STRAF|nr:excinuclease ABC subunit A [Striga asiatica]